MKRILLTLCFTLVVNIVTIPTFAQTSSTKTIVVEINNVTKNAGTVHISVSLNEQAYKKRLPNHSFQIFSTNNVVKVEMTLPLGDCVINVYQDCNGNGKCDNNLLGIPKEPVGISNWNGKGIPSNFNKHKANINDNTQMITVNLYQL